VGDAGQIVSKAVGLGVQVDTQATYQLLSAAFQGGASLMLQPRSRDRWYRVGVVSAPDGASSRKEVEATSGGTTTRTETTETDYGVAVDAEIARIFGPVTLRGGMLQSTAGFGLDYRLLDWLSLSGEFFDFRSGALPNLRGTLTLYPFFDPDSDKPWNWIYFRGGISDALGADRDYFFGAGLRFTDDEVRGLVGLVPLAGN